MHRFSFGRVPSLKHRHITVSKTSSQNSRQSSADVWDEIPQKQRAVFQDVDAMKKKLREKLSKPEYNVSMYYHDHGIAQKIATSSLFGQVTLLIITLNAIWISVDIDYNPSEVLARAPWGFQLTEQLFCFYFVFEWTTRFMAFKRKVYGLRDAWFVFDTLLTFLFVIDSWVMYLYMKIGAETSAKGLGDTSVLRVVRLVRLTRMARMAHILRAVPELSILLKALGAAMRCVSFTLVLLVGLLYIFAVVFRLFCSETEKFCKDSFASVPQSMHTLLISGTFMDNLEKFVHEMQDYSPGLVILFYIFVILAAVTIMNQLIGILCEVVNNTAEVERETLSINYVKQKLQTIMVRAGMSDVFRGEAKINQEEFLQLIHNRAAASVLEDVGVDAVGLVDFVDFIFKDDLMELEETEEKLLSFAELVEVILKLRGNNHATVKDIIDQRKFVQVKLAKIEAKLDAIAGRHKSRKGTLNLAAFNEASMKPVGSNSSEAPFRPMNSTGASMRSVGSTSSEAPFRPMGSEASFGRKVSPLENDGQNMERVPAKCQSMPDVTSGTNDNSTPSTVHASANGKGRMTFGTYDGSDFRHLAQKLVLEHESALASMQRQSERLQAELDLLKSENFQVPTADCKFEAAPCKPSCPQKVSEDSLCTVPQGESIGHSLWRRNMNKSKERERCFQIPLPVTDDGCETVGKMLSTSTIQSDLAPIPTAPSTRSALRPAGIKVCRPNGVTIETSV